MEDLQILLKRNTHHPTLNHVIRKLHHNEVDTDVTLACSGKKYLLHKLVLVICSEYFSELFESNKCTSSMIILTGIQCSDIELLIDFMYTGEVNVRKDKISSLMNAAEFLKVKGLASPESISCSIVSKKACPPLDGKNSFERSTNLNPRTSCTSPMQMIDLENDKEVKGIYTTDEREDKSDIEIVEHQILPSTNFLEDLQTTIKEDGPSPLSMSDYIVNDLGGTSEMKNNFTSSCVRKNIGFTANISGAVAAKQSPSLKRRRTGTDSTPGFNSSTSRSCKLLRDPASSMYYFVTEHIVLDSCRKGITLNPCTEKEKGPILCNKDNCNERFLTIDNFRSHLTKKHGEDHPCKEFSFMTWNDLEKWKTEFEDENLVNFRHKGYKQRRDHKVKYYKCNRSSCFLKESTSTGKRKAKPLLVNGPMQSSLVCTSGMTVIEYNDGSLHVTVYPSHSNHLLDDKHKQCLRMPEALKKDIIKQMEMEVPHSDILGGIDEEIKKQYRLTYKKILSIKKKYVTNKA